jgi:hypothetical protein
MPKVIFRRSGQEIIALFPETAASNNPDECLIIRESGGKSAADIKMTLQQTKPAPPDDCIFLKEKLIGLGYEPLEVITREGKLAFKKRFKATAFGK